MSENNKVTFNIYAAYSAAQSAAILYSPSDRFVLTDVIISTTAANVVTLLEDSGADKPILKFDLAANGGAVLNLQTPIKADVDGADLLITSTATTTLYVTVCGYEEE
jgi:hypothetical protein